MVPNPAAIVRGIYRIPPGGNLSEGLIPLDGKIVKQDDLFGMGQHGALFYVLEKLDGTIDDDLIIDVLYDGKTSDQFDLRRGTDFPVGRSSWPDWFEIPKSAGARAPGPHTAQFRVGKRKFSQAGRSRDFSPENGGYLSPVFQFTLAAEAIH